jgi:hypothetical protein
MHLIENYGQTRLIYCKNIQYFPNYANVSVIVMQNVCIAYKGR